MIYDVDPGHKLIRSTKLAQKIITPEDRHRIRDNSVLEYGYNPEGVNLSIFDGFYSNVRSM